MKRWQCKDIPDAVALQAAVDAHNRDCRARPIMFTIHYIIERTGAPYNVAHAKLLRLDQRGLVDYGVSLRTCWATDKGLALLAASTPPPREA